MTPDDRELAEKLLTPIFGRRRAAKEFVADNPEDVKEMLGIITSELAAKVTPNAHEIMEACGGNKAIYENMQPILHSLYAQLQCAPQVIMELKSQIATLTAPEVKP